MGSDGSPIPPEGHESHRRIQHAPLLERPLRAQPWIAMCRSCHMCVQYVQTSSSKYKSGCTCTHARSRYTGLARAEGETPHTRAPVVLAWRVLKVGDLYYVGGDAAHARSRCTGLARAEGVGPLLRGETLNRSSGNWDSADQVRVLLGNQRAVRW
eukprot:3255597-Prymnesium_polylepis.1